MQPVIEWLSQTLRLRLYNLCNVTLGWWFVPKVNQAGLIQRKPELETNEKPSWDKKNTNVWCGFFFFVMPWDLLTSQPSSFAHVCHLVSDFGTTGIRLALTTLFSFFCISPALHESTHHSFSSEMMYSLKLECSSTIENSVKSHHLLIRLQTLAWAHDVIVGSDVTLFLPLLQIFTTGQPCRPQRRRGNVINDVERQQIRS